MVFKKGNTPWNKGEKGLQVGYNKGKHLSEELKEKISNSAIEWYKTHSSPMLGKHHTEETKKKMSEVRIGKSLSEETKQKMGLKRIGIPLSEEHRKKISKSNKGKIMLEETKNKLSIAHKGLASGNKHPNWKGGISFEPYGLEFNRQLKEQIRKRDNYTCQECHFTQDQLGYTLSVHHIDFNKKNNKPKNLISLCIKCHTQTNYNRNDWIDYFKKRVG